MTSIYDMPTPAVVVDQSRLTANIDRMQAAADAGGLRLRPHAKTHKSPAIAARQLTAGAIGITCAKLGEAEVFAEAGIRDIRVAYPLHPANAGRVVALLDRAALSIVVDHPRIAREWSAAMLRAGRSLPVLVKVDVGFHRCGVNPASPDAIDLVMLVEKLPGLELQGLLSHAGHAYHADSEAALCAIARDEAETLHALRALAREQGIEIRELSVGATATARFSAQDRRLTELRPGNYVYNDRTQVGLAACTIGQCALTIVATVVSKPAPDRVIFDSGSKTLSSDGARGFRAQEGHGVVFVDPESIEADEDLLIERLSEEHATVRVRSGSTRLEPGDRVRILPNHSCVVSNLVDEIHVADGAMIVERLPVAARGKIA
jgi:D-serine deaminase-like pyridoxal phosphate-dependent protein